MRPGDLLLATLVAAIWGFNFIAVHVGLDDLPPLLFCGLRLLAAALPLAFLRRGPGVAWRWVLLSAACLGVLHFSLFFWGMAEGMPAGLTSLVLQSQAIFTLLLAVPLLRERPGVRRIAGTALALAGMVLVGATLHAGTPAFAFALVVASAAFWGLNNIVLRRAAPLDPLRYTMWLAALAALPMLGLSLVIEGPSADLAALRGFDLTALAALAYTSGISTIVGFGLWGRLIHRYGAGTVAPFSMLVPFFGMTAAVLVLHEALRLPDVLGGVLVIGGILFGATRARSRTISPPGIVRRVEEQATVSSGA